MSDSELYRPSDSLTNNMTQIAVLEQKQLRHHVIVALLLSSVSFLENVCAGADNAEVGEGFEIDTAATKKSIS